MSDLIPSWNLVHKLEKRNLLVGINCVAALSILFFGYDQGMMSGVNNSKDYIDLMGFGYTEMKDGMLTPVVTNSLLRGKILKKQKKAAEEGPGDQPGTVYIGRIPHGFYEHQMRAYFSQFGEITRLRLSRNRITGRSKHYAFVEFSSASVAKIVAETMDNYLMYGHILKCKFIPSEQLHPEIWKGANRRFKKTPWNRIEKKRLDKGKTREQWSGSIAREQKRRLAKAEKLKETLGYELELPELMDVDQVPVREETKAIEDTKSTEEPVKAIEEPSSKETEAKKNDDDTPKKSKSKKEKKGAQTTEKETPKKDAVDVKKDDGKAEKKDAGEQKTGAKAKKAEKKKDKAIKA